MQDFRAPALFGRVHPVILHPAKRSVSRHRLFTMALLCATALAGCNKAQDSATQNGAPATGAPIAALALATSAPPPTAYAPPVQQIPPAPVRIATRSVPRSERYRYIDDASTMSGAFGATPPDYTVDYDGTRPWVWRSDDGDYRIVELLPEGERIYYYHAGASEPFLIRDPDYAYAYDGDDVVAVYGPDGAPLDDMIASRQANEAGAYLYRARGLYRAATQEQRQAAYAANWQERQSDIGQQQQSWDTTRDRDAEWHQWHDSHQAQEDDHWAHERDQRTAYAAAIGVAVGAAGMALLGGHHDDSNHAQGGQGGQAPMGQRPADAPRTNPAPDHAYFAQPRPDQPYSGQQNASHPAQPNPARHDMPQQRSAFASPMGQPTPRSDVANGGSHDFQAQHPHHEGPSGPGGMPPAERPHPSSQSFASQRDRPSPPPEARVEMPVHRVMEPRPAMAPQHAMEQHAMDHGPAMDRPRPEPHPDMMKPGHAPERIADHAPQSRPTPEQRHPDKAPGTPPKEHHDGDPHDHSHGH